MAPTQALDVVAVVSGSDAKGNLRQAGIRDPRKVELLSALCGGKCETGVDVDRVKVGFNLPDRPRIIREVLCAFGLEHDPSSLPLARTMALALTDDMGRGLVSLTQLWEFLGKYTSLPGATAGGAGAGAGAGPGGDVDASPKPSEGSETAGGDGGGDEAAVVHLPGGLAACAAAARAELVDKPRGPRPPAKVVPPPPVTFVSEWLKEAGLDKYVNAFVCFVCACVLVRVLCVYVCCVCARVCSSPNPTSPPCSLHVAVGGLSVSPCCCHIDH